MNSPTCESSVKPCTPWPFTANTSSQLELYLIRCETMELYHTSHITQVKDE